MDWGKAQFIEIIEWLDDSNDIMAWRFPVRNQEIKNGAKLVCRESQEATFVSEGQFGDTFIAGTHTLTTQNLPVLADLSRAAAMLRGHPTVLVGDVTLSRFAHVLVSRGWKVCHPTPPTTPPP